MCLKGVYSLQNGQLTPRGGFFSAPGFENIEKKCFACTNERGEKGYQNTSLASKRILSWVRGYLRHSFCLKVHRNVIFLLMADGCQLCIWLRCSIRNQPAFRAADTISSAGIIPEPLFFFSSSAKDF
jgi:hypothetical protein